MIRVLAITLIGVILANKNDQDERVSNLYQMTYNKGLIKMDTKKFDDYVRIRPRNYSVIAMTTALNPKRGCQVCKEAHSEFTILYNSYRTNNNKDFQDKKVFFAIIDFDDASDVFQQLKLNSAPGFFHFPPSTAKSGKEDKLDLQRSGFQAENLAKWVNDRTGVAIQVTRPPSYFGLIIIGVFGLLIFSMAYMTGFKFDWLLNKSLWSIICILLVLLMISAQMWNHIRGPPPMGKGHGNRMVFIAPSSQMQYVFETYWIFLVYGAISYSAIMLADKGGDTLIENGKRRVYSFTGIVFFFIFYSLLLATFRQKYQGYPYKLIF